MEIILFLFKILPAEKIFLLEECWSWLLAIFGVKRNGNLNMFSHLKLIFHTFVGLFYLIWTGSSPVKSRLARLYSIVIAKTHC